MIIALALIAKDRALIERVAIDRLLADASRSFQFTLLNMSPRAAWVNSLNPEIR